MRKRKIARGIHHGIGMLLVLAGSAFAQEKMAVKVDPSAMAKLGTVDPRYLSWNVEMVEVTGGRFWKPYSSAAGSASRF